MMIYKSGWTNGIPSSNGRESSRATSPVRTRANVVEAREPLAVQPGIEESKRILALRNKVVINQRDYARHGLDIGGQLGA